MTSKTRPRFAYLPSLLAGLALVSCTDASPKPVGSVAGVLPGAAGTSNPSAAGGAVTTGAPAAGSSTEGNPVLGGISTGGPPPTGVVACDESVIGSSAPNALTVDVDTPSTVIPK
jgi:hypothetical protein